MPSHSHSHPPASPHRHADHHHAAPPLAPGWPVLFLMTGLGGRLLVLLPVLALLWALIAWAILSE